MNSGGDDPAGDFVTGIPKAELHMHVEGSLEPELMFELAGRNGISVPYASVEEVREAHDIPRSGQEESAARRAGRVFRGGIGSRNALS